jgi:hypothetical protein
MIEGQQLGQPTSPRTPSISCRTMLAFVSITLSITIFPVPFLPAIEMLSL